MFLKLKNLILNPVILINNGIHPGEPDGIDATMMLMRDLALGKIKIPQNTKVAAIEAYNISGMMRRGKFSRANQNGPEEYGFRGNARNFDLNRDFIKNDTENAKAFQEIFHWLEPIYFIDNHVSNGADYQYTFTYISTNKERLGSSLGTYFHKEMQPKLIENLEKDKILCVLTLIFTVIRQTKVSQRLWILPDMLLVTPRFLTWEPWQKRIC
jgi:hypothetical protein